MLFNITTSDGNKTTINGTFLTAGGQGQLYKCQENNKQYIIKAILDDDRIFEKLRLAKTRLLSLPQSLPPTIAQRSFFVGQGYCPARDLNITTSKHGYLLMFPWLDAAPLEGRLKMIADSKIAKYISNGVIDNFQLRKKIALDIVESLTVLEKAGIVHGDLYPDNFMIDSNDHVFMIDLEGCGILREDSTEVWFFKPMAAGKRSTFPPPPPPHEYVTHQTKDGEIIKLIKTSSYTDRWTGLCLIWYILTGLPHPFPFLKRADHSILQVFKKHIEDTNSTDWLKPNLTGFDKWGCPMADYQRFFKKHFNQDFANAFYDTFIKGYQAPQKRTSFQKLHSILKHLNLSI